MLDPTQVRAVARLAHLTLGDAEVESLRTELSRILEYVAKLNELDTSGVPPTTHAVPLATALRDDVAQPGLAPERALANAPEPLGGGFGVPKIVE